MTHNSDEWDEWEECLEHPRSWFPFALRRTPETCAECGRSPTCKHDAWDFACINPEEADEGAPTLWHCPECHTKELQLVADFIDQRCLLGDGYEARPGDLHRAYTQWCRDNEIDHPLTEPGIERALDELDFGRSGDIYTTIAWLGLKLLPTASWTALGLMEAPALGATDLVVLL